MTTRWAEIEAGARRDLVVFVDDWKGTPPVLDTTPVAYVGRAYRHDEAFESLANTLERAEAHRWHVSQRGSGSLFISPQFGEVLQILEESRSVLFSQVWTMGQYTQADVKGFVSSLQPEFRSAWRVHNPHGLALLEFALRLRWYLGNTELAKRDALSVLFFLVSTKRGRLQCRDLSPSESVNRCSLDALLQVVRAELLRNCYEVVDFLCESLCDIAHREPPRLARARRTSGSRQALKSLCRSASLRRRPRR
jgi:hypothetical protein